MRRLLSSVAVLGALTACGTSGAPYGSGATPAIPVPEAAAAEHLAQCQGNGFVRYVGHPLVMPGDPLPAEGAYVGWEDLPDDSRVLGPGVRATMDYRPDRLNVVIDAERRIHRLYCG